MSTISTEYPTFNTRREAVVYANAHGLEPYQLESGLWSVREIIPPDPTKEELYQELARTEKDCQDSGMILRIINGETGAYYYLKSDSETRSTLNDEMLTLSVDTTIETVNWPIYNLRTQAPVGDYTFTRSQFVDFFKFMSSTRKEISAVLTEQNAIVAEMTDAQLHDKAYIKQFREDYMDAFNAVPREFRIVIQAAASADITDTQEE